MKKNIILNERAYAENCLKSGTIDEKPFTTLSILAKYYYHVCGYRKTRIYKALVEFMECNYPLYSCNKAYWDNTIERISNSAEKYKLFEIDGIWITKSEINTIDSIKSSSLRRVSFVLICLAKLGNVKNSNNNGWVNYDAKDVFSIARVNCRSGERYQYYDKLNQIGLLEYPKRNDNLSVRVTYIDEDSDNLLFISDFRELGYEYLNFHGGNFTRCKKCGILIRDSKWHDKLYCSNCKGYEKQVTKKIVCVDCGKEFEVDARTSNKCRCDTCQYEKNKIDTRNRVRLLREKRRM